MTTVDDERADAALGATSRQRIEHRRLRPAVSVQIRYPKIVLGEPSMIAYEGA